MRKSQRKSKSFTDLQYNLFNDYKLHPNDNQIKYYFPNYYKTYKKEEFQYLIQIVMKNLLENKIVRAK